MQKKCENKVYSIILVVLFIMILLCILVHFETKSIHKRIVLIEETQATHSQIILDEIESKLKYREYVENEIDSLHFIANGLYQRSEKHKRTIHYGRVSK